MLDHVPAPSVPLAPHSAKTDLAECPHCHFNVMFHADGTCPSCQKNGFDTQGVVLHETVINVDHDHLMPCVCFLCGAHTDAEKELAWSYYVGPHDAWLPRLFYYLPGSHYRATHRVTLPVCASCAPAAKRVTPLSVRPRLFCRLLVHRTFRTEFEKLNGPEVIEWDADIRVSAAPKPPLINLGDNPFKY